MNTIAVWVGLGVLGGVGALLRFRLDRLIALRSAGPFPFGTLVVNVVGSFGLGLLTGLSVTGDASLLAGTGMLGSFTTFSTWMLETERLGEEGEERVAVANVIVPLAGGLVATIVGWMLGGVL